MYNVQLYFKLYTSIPKPNVLLLIIIYQVLQYSKAFLKDKISLLILQIAISVIKPGIYQDLIKPEVIGGIAYMHLWGLQMVLFITN